MGDRFPLSVNTARVTRPLTRAVNSGSGNRALIHFTPVQLPIQFQYSCQVPTLSDSVDFEDPRRTKATLSNTGSDRHGQSARIKSRWKRYRSQQLPDIQQMIEKAMKKRRPTAEVIFYRPYNTSDAYHFKNLTSCSLSRSLSLQKIHGHSNNFGDNPI